MLGQLSLFTEGIVGVWYYGRVQAQAVETLTTVKKGADVSKPTVVAL
jgi:hypothetical protein